MFVSANRSKKASILSGFFGNRKNTALKFFGDIQLQGGCRKITYTKCPGSLKTQTRLERMASMYLVNVGSCRLYVSDVHANGEPIDRDASHFFIDPGEEKTFKPDLNTHHTAVACDETCKGVGAIEHEFACV